MTGSEACGIAGDRDQLRRRVALAGAGFGRIEVVDHGEVRRFRIVGNLDPHRGAGGIVGEADVAVRLPGEGGDLDGGARDLDAGPRPGQLAACEQGDNRQRNNRGQDLQTQHDTLPAHHKPGQGTYGWQRVKETSYRRIDAGCFCVARHLYCECVIRATKLSRNDGGLRAKQISSQSVGWAKRSVPTIEKRDRR